MQLHPPLILNLHRTRSGTDPGMFLYAKVRDAVDEEFIVTSVGSDLNIEAPPDGLCLRKEQIALLMRLQMIAATLKGKLDATNKEWELVSELALVNYVDGYIFDIGPELNAPEDKPSA